MRITRESLLTLARDVSALRFRQDHDVMCIYLTGSMRLPSPLLGGATDIDLVFVHAKEPAEAREIQKISDDVTLDIAHLPQSAFDQPRRLRSDPWLGSFLCENPVVLQEHQHWFEFTQAAVASRFYAPEMVLSRVKPLLESARGAWLALQTAGPDAKRYLDAVEASLNAFACLYGPPLTERRMLLDFDALAVKVEAPDLSAQATGLVQLRSLPEDFWESFTPRWTEALQAAGSEPASPKKLLPARRNYYLKACEALLADAPAAALWIMLKTWSLAQPLHSEPRQWEDFLAAAGFDRDGWEARLEALDRYLDNVEEWVEKWTRYNGL